MKRYGRFVGLAVLLVTLGACDDDSPTAPTDPNTIVFTAQLAASNEVPPITGTEAAATGNVRITLNVTRDAGGAITGGTASFVINLAGFPNGTNATAAHIHEGAPGIAGGVRIGVTPLTAANPISMPNGSATNVTYNGITLDATGVLHANQMLTNPNGYYFNVHTVTNPGGAVRGPLVIQ